jgi:ERCC4-type nuclease
MKIEIDYRERDLIALFEKEINEEKVDFKVCNLLIGDFIIKKDENVLFVIERKSVKDLCASIIDGRHTEQKSRLLESVIDPLKIVYIIEGKKEFSQGISKNTINSSILNLIFKHNYRVIFTDSKQDTYDNLILLYNKIKDDKLEISDTIQTMKLIKKSDKINNNIFINMLSVIPRISGKIAFKIYEKYNNLNILMKSYSELENEDGKKNMLSNIIINNRKLGKVASEKIYTSLYGINNTKNEIQNNQEINCLLD